MPLEKEESGFYFGTTSIGYVFAILFVILPVCVLVVRGLLEMWTGVIIGILASILLCIALYPLFLSWVIMVYFVVCPRKLPQNQAPPTPDSD